MSEIKQDLYRVMEDIINIRSHPTSMISSFDTVYYSLAGFKNSEKITNFISEFITFLNKLKPLPKLIRSEELDKVASIILKKWEQIRFNPNILSQKELNEIASPIIKNIGKLSVIADTNTNSKRFINKIIQKEEEGIVGKNSNHPKIFDLKAKFIGGHAIISNEQKNELFYVIVISDKFEKAIIHPEGLVSKDQLEEYQSIFNLFDFDKDGIINNKDLNIIKDDLQLEKIMPVMSKFFNILDHKKYANGIDFDKFVDAIIQFGNFSLDIDDSIKMCSNYVAMILTIILYHSRD